jgi:heptaprenyl diphosphate synthase
MFLAHKFTKLSIVGVSVVGAIFHSIGQMILALIILNIPNVIFYLPYLLLLSLPTGILVGMIAKKVISYYKKS